MIENISLYNSTLKSSLELGMVNTPHYILETCDWGSVQSNNYSYKYINQIGSQITNTTLEERDISISGWIVADSKAQMTALKEFISGFFNPLQIIELTYKTYKLSFRPATSIQYGQGNDGNNEVIVKFNVDGVCSYPLFEDVQSTYHKSAAYQGNFHFPLTISENPNPPGGVIFGEKITARSSRFNIINKGDVDTGCIITFGCMAGTLKNPSVIDVNTGSYFKLNKELVKGETVTINTNIGSKSIRGKLEDVEANYFHYRDYDSDWLQLKVGDNVWFYQADENEENLSVQIEFTNKYLEVQEWD